MNLSVVFHAGRVKPVDAGTRRGRGGGSRQAVDWMKKPNRQKVDDQSVIRVLTHNESDWIRPEKMTSRHGERVSVLVF